MPKRLMIGSGLDSNNHPFSGGLTSRAPEPRGTAQEPARPPNTTTLHPADATGEGMKGQGRIQQLGLGRPSLSVRSSLFFGEI